MKKVVSYIAMVLAVAEIVLILVSWLLSATVGDDVRSLLSSEGIRFFFGGFVNMLLSPLLVWIVLLSMAYGCLCSSGMLSMFNDQMGYRQRQTLFILVVVLLVYVVIVLALSVSPHAVLLSATGRLWPSAFSRALIPIIAFGIILLSTVYGLVSRHFLSLADVCQSLSGGIATSAPLLLLYVLFMQLFSSLRFAFSF